LVWPPSGKKRVTVDYQDLERLEEEQFLNDNIINFYLRFLEENLALDNPALAQQTHFFNTFFYERLSQKTADRKYLTQDHIFVLSNNCYQGKPSGFDEVDGTCRFIYKTICHHTHQREVETCKLSDKVIN
ncbi:hypothetical protein BGX38DRAFT_1096039, partial [Terfezia claveryi]